MVSISASFVVIVLAQYMFIHDAFSELITCGNTEISANSLRAKFRHLDKLIPGKVLTGFAHQFQLLEQVSQYPEEENNDATEHYNRVKNRYPDKLPYNLTRAHLRHAEEDGSDYINASFIDGYKQRNAYIATQGPLPNTVNDLLRMLLEFKSKIIVTLCHISEEGEEVCHPFWPSQGNEAVHFGGISVTLLATTNYDHFEVRKLQVQVQDDKNEGVVVTQFHHLNWPQHGSPQTGTFVEMLDLITKMQMSTGNRPITVVCNDGVGRTGTFICISSQLERLKTEGMVDLFQSIKLARTQRAQLVLETGQFAFAHQVLADYMDKFDNYANFKDMD